MVVYIDLPTFIILIIYSYTSIIYDD